MDFKLREVFEKYVWKQHINIDTWIEYTNNYPDNRDEDVQSVSLNRERQRRGHSGN